MPGEFEIYHVFDTIRFEFEARDESKLESIVVDIADEEFRTVLAGVEIQNINANLLQVAREIVIDDIHISSGEYYIRVRISDGENEKVDFRPCTIIEEPLQIKRFVALKNNGLSTQIDTLGLNDDNWNFAGNIGFETNFFAINSWHQEMAAAHSTEGQITWVDALELSQINFQQLPSPGGNQFWRDYYFDYEKLVYLGSTEDGFIRAYKPGGNVGISIVLNNNFRAGKLRLRQNDLLAEIQSFDLNTRQIALYQFNTGVLQQSRTIDFDIVEIIAINDDEILLFGNDNDGNGTVVPYFISANATGFPLPISLNEIIGAGTDLLGNYLVATNTEIRKFMYDGNGTFSVAGNSLAGNYNYLQYEPVTTTFSAMNNNQIVFISANLSIAESISLPNGTDRFGIIYNK